ncbi:MAG TPA: FecR family protein, partial [Mucilaginibacter sp.]|nr:FecR family protein [Mucilaginibacter sp.]
MEDQKERIIILLSLYAEDRITRRELDELLGYIADARHDGTLHDYLLAEWEGLDTGRALPEPNWDKMLNSITGKPNQQAESEQNQYEYNENHKNNIRRLRWTRYAIAASVLIAIGTSTIFLLNQRHPQGTTTEHDVAPYTAQAILKTGGKTIVLDKTQNGKIAQTNVTKSQGEQLAYAITPATQTIQYDTIQIPKGGRPYTVQLSDGTKLTLNAATTVRYPETFAGNKREGVELISGEIYAEVTHNEKQPFSIKAPGQLIQDIGTEFNMSAYEDESEYRTTLVTG